MDIKGIKKFIELIQNTDITELNWEKDGLKIGFKKGLAPELNDLKTKKSLSKDKKIGLSSEIASVDAKKEIIEKHKESAKDTGLITIKAPMVGTFYRSAAPDTSYYVEEGSVIEKGQKICVIEAMKVMKEINAQESGKIVKILIKHGDNVEYGQDMFVVDTKIKNS